MNTNTIQAMRDGGMSRRGFLRALGVTACSALVPGLAFMDHSPHWLIPPGWRVEMWRGLKEVRYSSGYKAYEPTGIEGIAVMLRRHGLWQQVGGCTVRPPDKITGELLKATIDRATMSA